VSPGLHLRIRQRYSEVSQRYLVLCGFLEVTEEVSLMGEYLFGGVAANLSLDK
jgi:hypothetical protein